MDEKSLSRRERKSLSNAVPKLLWTLGAVLAITLCWFWSGARMPSMPAPVRALDVLNGTGACGVDGEVTLNQIPKRTTRNDKGEYVAHFTIPDSTAPVTMIYKAPGDAVGIEKTFVLPPGPRQILIGDCIPVTVESFQVAFALPRPPARKGLVRIDSNSPKGKSLIDDGGGFHPLGVTMMWAAYGEKYEHDRWIANMDLLAGRADYVRVLGQVLWPDEVIDPAWPDYEAVLGRVIDQSYARGLRVELTVMGGGLGEVGAMEAARKAVSVINAGRQHKVIAVECWNESFATRGDVALLVKMAEYLKANLPDGFLIALSSPGGNDQELETAAQQLGLKLRTRHIDRGPAEGGYRQARQGWDFKDIPFVVGSNEPPGPASSVATQSNPTVLATTRANGVLAGGAMYVFHIGHMIYGRQDDSRDRKANIWEAGCAPGEVPNQARLCSGLDLAFKALRNVDKLLPVGIEDWSKYEDSSPGHPLRQVNGFWCCGENEGVNRNYAAINGDEFVLIAGGVKERMIARASRNMHVEAFDILTGNLVGSADLMAGQTWELPGRSNISDLPSYMIRGTFK